MRLNATEESFTDRISPEAAGAVGEVEVVESSAAAEQPPRRPMVTKISCQRRFMRVRR